MGEQNQELQNQLNQLDIKNEKLKQITQEIKDLIDGNDNTKFELAGKLNTEVANALKDNQDFANSLQKIIEGINTESLSQQDKNSLTQLTNFIQPYIQNFDFSIENNNNKKGNFVKNIDKGEENSVKSAKTRIEGLINKTDGNLNQTLNNILQILQNPYKDNTQKLQEFLYNKLDGDNKTKFYKDNYGKSGRDGQFGPNTMEGLNIFLNSVDKYIESLNNSKNIQEEHDKTNKENAERQQELINNLKIDNVMAILPEVITNDEEIKNLINLISEIENGGYKSEQEREWEKNALEEQIQKDTKDLNELENNLDNWNDYKKKQEEIAKNSVYLRNADQRYTNDEKKAFKQSMETEKINQQNKVKLLKDKIEKNKGKQKEINDYPGSSNDMILTLMGKINEIIQSKKNNLTKEYQNLTGQKITIPEDANESLRKSLEEAAKVTNNKIDAKITENNTILNKIEKFYNSKDYIDYINKLKSTVTETPLEEKIDNKENAKIDGNNIIAKLRGDWKKLDTKDIENKKKEIATKLNFYTENWEILPPNIKEVLILAKEALESKTDKDIDDKSYKVYLLEQKLDMPENMKDPKVHNSIDGKFGHETYNALINYIDASLKKSTEIKTDEINVTLRGEWKKLTKEEEIQAKKEEIAKELNDLGTSKRENRSDDQKIVLGLAKVALNSQSDANDDDKSNEVLVLENKLVELGYMPKEANDGKNDGPDGKFGDKTYNALKKCLNGDNPDYKSN